MEHNTAQKTDVETAKGANFEVALTFKSQQEHKENEHRKAIEKELLSSNELDLGSSDSSSVGDMSFQVCGGVQATLVSLQAVVFDNEAKVMRSSTKNAQNEYTMQGTEAASAYQGSIAAGSKQKEQATLSAIQSFTTAGVSTVGLVGQFADSKFSESAENLDRAQTKLHGLETLSEKTRMSNEEVEKLGSVQVGDKELIEPGKNPSPGMRRRIQELCSTGGAQPYKLEGGDAEAYESKQDKSYDPEKGSYYVKEFDDEAISQMTPEGKAAAYKAVQKQIEVVKQEINTAQSQLKSRQDIVQNLIQLGTQFAQGIVSTQQGSVQYDQKLDEAIATMENQAFGVTGSTAQVAAQAKKDAADAGTQTANAIMAAISASARG